MRALAEALRFLTILPVPGKPPKNSRAVFAAYPWAGLVVGVLTALGAWLGARILGTGGVAVLVVVLKMLITGGLHMDGLADLADGLGGGRDREKRLAIMSDSRLGSFGALALISMFAMQAAAVSGLASAAEEFLLLPLLALAPILSRGIITAIIPIFPSARPGGMGDSSRRSSGIGAPIAAIVSTLVLSFAFSGFMGPVSVILTALVMFLAAWRVSKGLGGLTGDVYGALLEIGDLTACLSFLILVRFETALVSPLLLTV